MMKTDWLIIGVYAALFLLLILLALLIGWLA